MWLVKKPSLGTLNICTMAIWYRNLYTGGGQDSALIPRRHSASLFAVFRTDSNSIIYAGIWIKVLHTWALALKKNY